MCVWVWLATDEILGSVDPEKRRVGRVGALTLSFFSFPSRCGFVFLASLVREAKKRLGKEIFWVRVAFPVGKGPAGRITGFGRFLELRIFSDVNVGVFFFCGDLFEHC